MYFGEAQASIDDKGRLNTPRAFVTQMEANDHETWFMTRGFDRFVFFFEKSQWEQVLKRIETHAPLDPRMLAFRRMFIGGAAKVKRDAQSRFLIPQHLREYAKLDKEVCVLALEDHLEIWNKDVWISTQEGQMELYKQMAEELFGAATVPAIATATEGVQGQ